LHKCTNVFDDVGTEFGNEVVAVRGLGWN